MPPLREIIARHGIAARKSLGQHFILDLNLTRRIARAAGPLDDATVIEIGPGPGGLTRALLAAGARRVVAIERDPRCLAALGELASRYPGRLELVAGDALALDPATLSEPPRQIVANLPYNIATALLLRWLDRIGEYQSLVLMFQREVAERLVAAPRSPAYGRLSVLGAVALRAEDPLRPAAARLCTGAQGNLQRRSADAARGAVGAGIEARARTGHRGRLRAAPQDAALEPQIAGPAGREAARGGRYRADRARRRAVGRPILRPGAVRGGSRLG